MLRSIALALLVAVCVAQTNFFGCTLSPHPSVTSSGSGFIVCMDGMNDGVASMACTFSVTGLTSNITLAHWHVGSTSDATGPVTFTFSGLPNAKDGVFVENAFTAASGYTVRTAPNFAAQIADCHNANPQTTAPAAGCYFNVHTVDHGSGELFCQGTAISPYLDFDFGLTPNGNRAASQGSATVWHGYVPGDLSLRRVWGYNLAFDVGSDVTAAHIHRADAVAPATGPVEVTFNIAGHTNGNNPGGFVGVSIFGTSRWPTLSSGFDSAWISNFTYVNVHTVDNAGGEVRGNFGISSATSVSVSFAAIFVVLAKLFA
jgi:hypothetical protein